MIVSWIKNNGQPIYLGAMSIAHLKNCIGAINAGRIRRPRCSGFSNAEWVKIFEAELLRKNRLGVFE